MFKTKNLKIAYFTTIGVMLGLVMITFIVLDFNISSSFSTITDWYTVTFRSYGNLIPIFPGFILVFNLINGLMFKYNKNEKKRILYTALICSAIFIGLPIYFLWNYIVFSKELTFTWEDIDYICVFALIWLCSIIYMIVMLSVKKFRTVYVVQWMNINSMYFAWYVIMLSIAVFILKGFFGRIRPRELANNNGAILQEAKKHFFYAFEPNFTSVRSQSFPSGHTSAACTMLGLIYLVGNNTKNQKIIKYLLSIFIWSQILLTAISRILIHAHWPSDVTFAIILAIIYFYTVPMALDSIYKKLDAKKQRERVVQ